MDYAFRLKWEELNEDLQEEKISEYIERNIHEYEEDFRDRNDIPEGGVADMSDVIEDEENRENAVNRIEAHFPMYF